MKAELQNAALVPPAAEEDHWPPLLRILLGHRVLVAVVALLTVALGVAYAQLATPVFRSDALLQVEERKKGIAGLEELTALLPSENPVDPELEILRSRSLVLGVIRHLGLDVEARPRRFPIIGNAIARAHNGPGLAEAPELLSSFAWGGEELAVDRLDVPPALEDQRLILTALGEGRFRLSLDGSPVLDGVAGQAAEARGLSLFVSRLQARPETEFVLRKVPVDEAIERFEKSLVMAERGTKTGIVRLELSGDDRVRVAASLQALIDAYVRQNVGRKSEEAEKTLEFVNGQLPEIKARLDAAEQALNDYRSHNGRVDVPLETKAAIDRSVEIEKTAAELRMQRSELTQRFTPNHPTVMALQRKISQIDADRAALEGRIRRLPAAELTSMRLLRDVKLTNELYTLLLNKAQELQVVKSGTLGNVRVLDAPLVPRLPAEPRKGMVALLSLALGLFLGVVAAFARSVLAQGVEDPDQLESATGLHVYATIPHAAHAGPQRGRPGPLAARDPASLTTEAVRSLRTSLQFALFETKTRVVVVCGPSPGSGKSFVAANLAQVLVDAGKKVLLIDGDLRNGSLHALFGVPRGAGLSELIAGSVPEEKAVHHLGPTFDLITAGTVPPNPSELLLSARFRTLLTGVASRYDLVLVDTPPVLAVTDSALIARLAGVTLLVLRCRRHPLREIRATLKQLTLGGARVSGLVFNDVPNTAPNKYGYHYQYAYKTRKAG